VARPCHDQDAAVRRTSQEACRYPMRGRWRCRPRGGTGPVETGRPAGPYGARSAHRAGQAACLANFGDGVQVRRGGGYPQALGLGRDRTAAKRESPDGGPTADSCVERGEPAGIEPRTQGLVRSRVARPFCSCGRRVLPCPVLPPASARWLVRPAELGGSPHPRRGETHPATPQEGPGPRLASHPTSVLPPERGEPHPSRR